jgi:hypothetical protein
MSALVADAALLELSSLLLLALSRACCLLLLLDAQCSSRCGCCWCLPAAGQTVSIVLHNGVTINSNDF